MVCRIYPKLTQATPSFTTNTHTLTPLHGFMNGNDRGNGPNEPWESKCHVCINTKVKQIVIDEMP